MKGSELVRGTQLEPAADPVFTGVAVALVTLFDADGEVDAEATARHARRLVDEGAQAVVVAGSTGEAAALSVAERGALLEAVRAVVPNAPVLAGTGAPSARQAVELTGQAKAAGADAVLVLSPPGSRDLAGYYAAVAEAAAGLPVLGYHFPKVSAPGIALPELAGLPLAGLKDSAEEPTRLLAETTEYDRPVYVGSAAMLPLAAGLGCAGAILALANAELADCVAAFGGDMAAARRLAGPHLRMVRGYPTALKQLVAERYGTSPATRLA